jgi:hypothetical protein
MPDIMKANPSFKENQPKTDVFLLPRISFKSVKVFILECKVYKNPVEVDSC